MPNITFRPVTFHPRLTLEDDDAPNSAKPLLAQFTGAANGSFCCCRTAAVPPYSERNLCISEKSCCCRFADDDRKKKAMSLTMMVNDELKPDREASALSLTDNISTNQY
jgi:hypothetical protein